MLYFKLCSSDCAENIPQQQLHYKNSNQLQV